ncbi:MAG TPA: hypothetical protein VGO66_05845 [Solirubrobacterales bacterium]|nr:hypothetical protein [Solirubrobacterales bacterium]
MIYKDGSQSPAGEAFDEAIDLALEDKSPYPERLSFIDAGTPSTEADMRRAAKDDRFVVLVSPDRSVRVIAPGEILGPDAADPPAAS